MKSKDNRKLSALKNQPFKITGAVTTAKSAAADSMVYYAKPSVPCKLIGAKLHVMTAAGAALAGVATFTKETAVTDPNLPIDAVTFGFQKLTASPFTVRTNPAQVVTAGTTVSNDNFLQFPAANTVNTANTTNTAKPYVDLVGAENVFFPKNNDVVVIEFPCGNHATQMVATLELEFLPI